MIDIKWLAGFFDGDGCVCIEKSRNSYQLRITITNTNKEILELIQKQFGGIINTTYSKNKKHKSKHDLRWIAKEAKSLLKLIENELMLKKIQCEIALGFPDYENEKLTKDEKELREITYNILKILNKKGQ